MLRGGTRLLGADVFFMMVPRGPRLSHEVSVGRCDPFASRSQHIPLSLVFPQGSRLDISRAKERQGLLGPKWGSSDWAVRRLIDSSFQPHPAPFGGLFAPCGAGIRLTLSLLNADCSGLQFSSEPATSTGCGISAIFVPTHRLANHTFLLSAVPASGGDPRLSACGLTSCWQPPRGSAAARVCMLL
jgi:hypothetical protein